MVPEALGERLGGGAALHLWGEGRGTWRGDTHGERGEGWLREGATVDYEGGGEGTGLQRRRASEVCPQPAEPTGRCSERNRTIIPGGHRHPLTASKSKSEFFETQPLPLKNQSSLPSLGLPVLLGFYVCDLLLG